MPFKMKRATAANVTGFDGMVEVTPYEVKTKATTERVENAFKHNNILGGSYYRWFKLNNEKLQPEQKRFLVVLPRLATFNRRMLKVYPVHI